MTLRYLWGVHSVLAVLRRQPRWLYYFRWIMFRYYILRFVTFLFFNDDRVPCFNAFQLYCERICNLYRFVHESKRFVFALFLITFLYNFTQSHEAPDTSDCRLKIAKLSSCALFVSRWKAFFDFGGSCIIVIRIVSRVLLYFSYPYISHTRNQLFSFYDVTAIRLRVMHDSFCVIHLH
jgi:hypothetical protein